MMRATVRTHMVSNLRSVRQLEVFQAVMRTRNLSEAAREIRVSQPAVSSALKDFEAACGFTLFTRATGRLVPTDEAILVLEQVESLFARFNAFEDYVGELRTNRYGLLTVAAVPALSHMLLPEAYIAFQRFWTDVTVNVAIYSVRDVVAQVRDEKADIGFAFSPVVEGAVDVHTLMHSELVACTFATDVDETALCPEEFGQARLMVPQRRTGPGAAVYRAIEEGAIVAREVIEFNNADFALGMMQQVGGFVLTDPLNALAAQTKGARLRRFNPSIPITLDVLVSRHRNPSAAVAAFCEEVRDRLTGYVTSLAAIGVPMDVSDRPPF